MHVDGVDLAVERVGDLDLARRGPSSSSQNASCWRASAAGSGARQPAPSQSPAVAGRRTSTRRSGAIIEVTPNGMRSSRCSVADAGSSASPRGRLCRVSGQPADDALLGLDEVARGWRWTPSWVARAIARDALPVLGFGTSGEPVIVAAEVRAWRRRPDPHGDET